MLNQVVTQELASRSQLEWMIKTLDHWLQIYTQAVFILFAVTLLAFAWVVFSEMTRPKTNKKLRPYRRASNKQQLLQTEP